MYPADFGLKRCFHISCLFDKTKLLIVAENEQKTHPRNLRNVKGFDISLKNRCSELNLFIKAKNRFEKLDWKRLTIINVRIDQNEIVRNSCPCGACQNLLNYLDVRNIFHSTDNGDFSRFEIKI